MRNYMYIRKLTKNTKYMYKRLPLCQFRVSRYYHLCPSGFSFPSFFLYMSFHFNSTSKTVNMKQRRVSSWYFHAVDIFFIKFATAYTEVANRAQNRLLQLCINIFQTTIKNN